MMAVKDPGEAVGRSPEGLTLAEQRVLAGKYVALEIYTPAALPLRRIEAVGDSAAECIRQLRARGLDPTRYEFVRMPPPF